MAQHKEGVAAMGGICVEAGRKETRAMAKPFFRYNIFTFFKANFYTLFLKILLSPKDNDIKFIWLVESKGENQ